MSETNSGSIKRGAVGLQRFKESAVPGMYWGDRYETLTKLALFIGHSFGLKTNTHVPEEFLKFFVMNVVCEMRAFFVIVFRANLGEEVSVKFITGSDTVSTFLSTPS